jgi:hypothetical protein
MVPWKKKNRIEPEAQDNHELDFDAVRPVGAWIRRRCQLDMGTSELTPGQVRVHLPAPKAPDGHRYLRSAARLINLNDQCRFKKNPSDATNKRNSELI